MFEKTGIEEEKRKKIEDAMANANIEKFDEERTIDFIKSVQEFY